MKPSSTASGALPPGQDEARFIDPRLLPTNLVELAATVHLARQLIAEGRAASLLDAVVVDLDALDLDHPLSRFLTTTIPGRRFVDDLAGAFTVRAMTRALANDMGATRPGAHLIDAMAASETGAELRRQLAAGYAGRDLIRDLGGDNEAAATVVYVAATAVRATGEQSGRISVVGHDPEGRRYLVTVDAGDEELAAAMAALALRQVIVTPVDASRADLSEPPPASRQPSQRPAPGRS